MKSFKHRYLAVAALLAGAGLFSAAPALAVVHSGGTFTVSASVVDANTIDFVYTADFDTPGWTGAQQFIFAIDFKLDGYTVDTIDSFSTTAPGNWVTAAGPSNSNGCGGVNDTFACAEDNPFSEATGAATSGSYTWSFRVTFTTDVDPADFSNTTNHIGAFFLLCQDTPNPNDGDARECKGQNGLSENTTFDGGDGGGEDGGGDMPEPGTLALFGLGLLALGGLRRRRQI
jgi:PEP-CTERM motif